MPEQGNIKNAVTAWDKHTLQVVFLQPETSSSYFCRGDANYCASIINRAGLLFRQGPAFSPFSSMKRQHTAIVPVRRIR